MKIETVEFELTEKQCAAVLKLLNGCSPLIMSDKYDYSGWTPAQKARYEAASIMFGEWQYQTQKTEAELMDTIASIEEV